MHIWALQAVLLATLLAAAANAAPVDVKMPTLRKLDFAFSAVSNDGTQLLFSGAAPVGEPTDAVYTVDSPTGKIQRLTRTHGKQSTLDYRNNEPGRREYGGMYISNIPRQGTPATRKFEPVVMFGGFVAARADPRTFYCQTNDLWMFTYEDGYTPLYRTSAPADPSVADCYGFRVEAGLVSRDGVDDPRNTPPSMDPNAVWYDTQANLVWVAGGAVCTGKGVISRGRLSHETFCIEERTVWRYNVTSGMWAYFVNASRGTRAGVDPSDPGVPFRYFNGDAILRYSIEEAELIPMLSTTPDIPHPVVGPNDYTWHSVPGRTHVLSRSEQTACTVKFANGNLYGVACVPFNTSDAAPASRTYFGFPSSATTMHLLFNRAAASSCRPEQLALPDFEVALRQQETEEEVPVKGGDLFVDLPPQDVIGTDDEPVDVAGELASPDDEPTEGETSTEGENGISGESASENEPSETDPTDVSATAAVVPVAQITHGELASTTETRAAASNLTLIPRGRGAGAAEGTTLSPGAVAAIAVSGVVAVVLVLVIGMLIWSCTSGAKPRNARVDRPKKR
jgi:hypothetical protein